MTPIERFSLFVHRAAAYRDLAQSAPEIGLAKQLTEMAARSEFEAGKLYAFLAARPLV